MDKKTPKPRLIQPEEPLGFFQAVGVFNAPITFKDDSISIELDGKDYDLICSFGRKRVLGYLKKNIKKTGNSTQKIIVYPHTVHFPDRNKPHKIYFSLLGFQGIKQYEKNPISNILGDREFNLGGIWQFIPTCKYPVITVKKNLTDKALDNFKDMPEDIKHLYTKASHLPLFWRDESITPFRYNPKTKEQNPSYYVRIKAKFNPDKNTFKYVRILEEPREDKPKFISPTKKEKVKIKR